MNKKIISVLAMACGCVTWAYGADDIQLGSPDGRTKVTIAVTDGVPTYSVVYDGNVMVAPSPLGLNTNIGDYTGGMTIMEAGKETQVKDNYSLRNIKKHRVEYDANRRVVTFGKGDKKVYDVEFQVSDNNVAFRYMLHSQTPTLCCVVDNETTGFIMPEGTTTFLCPQMGTMSGFARTGPSYETHYTVDEPTGKNGWGGGYTFPCLFKVNDNGWVLVSETGIAGDYCGSRLIGNPDGSYTIGYPQAGEQNGFGSTSASIALPGYTPWRTITVGKNLAPIAETTIAWDVVKPLYEPSKDYKYGKGTWSWIIAMDALCNYEGQKKYIDFAADMGYTSVLVDALWDTNIGYEGIEKLAEYGHSKGVDLVLWYNSNGSWNDAPMGPRGVMNDIVKRRKDMAWMKKNGIRGIKVDFFGGDKQETMRLYHDILADANDYGILVIFHGCTLPRGWERMYPNYASSEAVRASENLHFGQGECDKEAFCATIHPFVRNTVGSMDFGGSALNKYWSADNARGTKRMTSDVFALATAVLFQSPLQHFALAPNNLTDAPEWAIEFMKNVPVTWDETRYIDGYPGQYAVLARRHNNVWYIAGINATDKPLTLNLTPDMMKPGETFTLYSDDKELNGSKTEGKVDKKGRVKMTIPTNGGCVMVTRPDEKFMVYLCMGQSNMEGAARYEECDTVDVPERFVMMSAVDMPGKGRRKGEWYTACPPLARQSTGLTPADYFGREMVKAMPEDVKIGVINVAVGGCKIELFDPAQCYDYMKNQPDWMKNFASGYENNPYKRMVEMARKAQADGGVIKGILLHQGESNTGDKEWPVKVKDLYERLLADLELKAEDVPLVAGEMLSAEEGGQCASMIDIVRTLPEVIPTAKVVSSAGCKGAPDGLHFTAEGYREIGRRYAQAMLNN